MYLGESESESHHYLPTNHYHFLTRQKPKEKKYHQGEKEVRKELLTLSQLLSFWNFPFHPNTLQDSHFGFELTLDFNHSTSSSSFNEYLTTCRSATAPDQRISSNQTCHHFSSPPESSQVVIIQSAPLVFKTRTIRHQSKTCPTPSRLPFVLIIPPISTPTSSAL